MVNYWLISGLRENLEVGIRIKMWAFKPERARRYEDRERFLDFFKEMREGDLAALRVVEFRDRRMTLAKIVGFAKISDVFYDEHHPIWPDEQRGTSPVYPWKVRFSSIVALSVENWPRIGLDFPIPNERFLSGIGLGRLLVREYVNLVKTAEERWGIMIRL